MTDCNTLLSQMNELVSDAELMTKVSPHDHAEICNILANHYDLWDEHERFPIWLSRIVEGAMIDARQLASEVKMEQDAERNEYEYERRAEQRMEDAYGGFED